MSKTYDHQALEVKWQAHWEQHRTFRVADDQTKTKFYYLDMFPYPSGSGLHVGHLEGYTATDIVSRYKRMRGFNVLHTIGWDAFGLPAEQFAVKTGVHPAQTTQENIANFRRQMQRVGLSYDWDREVDTTDPDYYRWTQWIFLPLHRRRGRVRARRGPGRAAHLHHAPRHAVRRDVHGAGARAPARRRPDVARAGRSGERLPRRGGAEERAVAPGGKGEDRRVHGR